MKINLKKFILLILVLALAYYLSISFGNLYENLIGSLSGSFIELRSIFGLPLAYTFFLTLLFTAFGGNKKYWWIGILLIPAIAFEVYFDFSHIYFPIILGLLGWTLGYSIHRFLQK